MSKYWAVPKSQPYLTSLRAIGANVVQMQVMSSLEHQPNTKHYDLLPSYTVPSEHWYT